MFGRFQAIFGNSFRQQFKSEKQIELALAEWGRELNKLSLEKIENGFDKLKQSGDTWPPSLPQFLVYCNGKQTGLRQDTEAYQVSPKALPKPWNKKLGQETVKSIKELLS